MALLDHPDQLVQLAEGVTRVKPEALAYRAKMALLDPKVNLDLTAPLDLKAAEARREMLDLLDPKVPLVPPVLPERPVDVDILGKLEPQVLLVRLEIKVHPVLRVPLAVWVTLVRLDHVVVRVRQVLLVLMATMDHPALLDSKVNVETLVPLVLKEFPEMLQTKVTRETKVLLDLLDPLVTMVPPELLVPMAALDHLAQSELMADEVLLDPLDLLVLKV